MNPQSTLPPTPAALPPKTGDPSAAGSGSKGPRSEVKLFAGLGHVALAVWAVIVIVPILWTFLAAFKNTRGRFPQPARHVSPSRRPPA
ncbi:hypothetical protein [Micromonospora sp. NPDC048843]|uniref:hypothetical protein n=1 Tax=Micromonospora sp. NPDC048843 TaxID=3155389 RepID=UPI0033CED8DE